MNDEALLHEVHDGLRADRIIGALSIPVVLVVAIGALVSFALLPPERQHVVSGIGIMGNWIVVGAFSGILVAVAFGAMLRYVKADPERAPVYRILCDTPERVVWIYDVAVYRNSIHSGTDVWLGLDDGASVGFRSSRSAPDLKAELLDALTRRCPSATFGYSEEAERAFTADPASLRRNPRSTD
jgi:hypothetical protein